MAAQNVPDSPESFSMRTDCSSPRAHSTTALLAIERAASLSSESVAFMVAAVIANRRVWTFDFGSCVAASALRLSLLLKKAARSARASASVAGIPHSSAQTPSIEQVKGLAAILMSSSRSSAGSGAPPWRYTTYLLPG